MGTKSTFEMNPVLEWLENPFNWRRNQTYRSDFFQEECAFTGGNPMKVLYDYFGDGQIAPARYADMSYSPQYLGIEETRPDDVRWRDWG